MSWECSWCLNPKLQALTSCNAPWRSRSSHECTTKWGWGLVLGTWWSNFEGSKFFLEEVYTNHTYLELNKLYDLPMEDLSVIGMGFECSKWFYLVLRKRWKKALKIPKVIAIGMGSNIYIYIYIEELPTADPQLAYIILRLIAKSQCLIWPAIIVGNIVVAVGHGKTEGQKDSGKHMRERERGVGGLEFPSKRKDFVTSWDPPFMNPTITQTWQI